MVLCSENNGDRYAFDKNKFIGVIIRKKKFWVKRVRIVASYRSSANSRQRATRGATHKCNERPSLLYGGTPKININLRIVLTSTRYCFSGYCEPPWLKPVNKLYSLLSQEQTTLMPFRVMSRTSA
jgi:hypothetical protein